VRLCHGSQCLTTFRLPVKNQFLQTSYRFWKKSGFNITTQSDSCAFVCTALNGFTATAGAPASPVLNGHAHAGAGAFSQSHAAATPAIYGTSAFFQLASPSGTFPAVCCMKFSVIDPLSITMNALNTLSQKTGPLQFFWHNFAKTSWLWIFFLPRRSRSYYLLVLSKKLDIGREPPA